jgi:EAL domain-containing protein (putative c-di-GMP-specific phosphodiesterase class I)
METDQGSGVIVRSVVDLGHNLGFRVVAEGVESAAIIDRLSTFACDIAQGYHISRPLSAEAFQQFRAAWPGLAGLPVQAAELSERKAVRH